MIAFDLKCVNDHMFEGWFDSGAAFDSQKARNLITCPLCGSNQVDKVLSSFTIGSGRQEPAENSSPPAELPPDAARKLIRQIYKYIETNFEDVGADFSKEALKIHYGVTEQRNIKGSSTTEEEEQLRDEGVSFMKIPVPRYDA